MFSVVNVYLDHLKYCVVCINSRRYVCCSECNVVLNECNDPTSCLVQHIKIDVISNSDHISLNTNTQTRDVISILMADKQNIPKGKMHSSMQNHRKKLHKESKHL